MNQSRVATIFVSNWRSHETVIASTSITTTRISFPSLPIRSWHVSRRRAREKQNKNKRENNIINMLAPTDSKKNRNMKTTGEINPAIFFSRMKFFMEEGWLVFALSSGRASRKIPCFKINERMQLKTFYLVPDIPTKQNQMRWSN